MFATRTRRNKSSKSRALTKENYVDDYIDSLGDETEAVEVTLKVRDIHAAEGFNVRLLIHTKS